MRARSPALVAVFTLLAFVAACGGDDRAESGLRKVEVVLGETLRIEAEVAATPQQRSTGLQNRPSLPPDGGMLFIFREPVRVNFYMKDTLIPLDIAFIGRGIVLEIRSMVPCPENTERCPLTIPAATFEMALEVNPGTFSKAGVGPGTPVRVDGDLPKAE
jgi:uncharacterized protein